MKRFIVFFCFIFLQSFAYPQPGWNWQNPLPQGNPLNSISFSAHSGWAVGENGTALHTSDYDEPWELVDLGIDEDLNGVYMHDDLMAFMVGDNGLILFVREHLETNTYEVKKLKSNTDKDLFSVTSDINGCPWVCGDEGTVLNSKDFGVTWDKQPALFGYKLYELSNIECTEAWVVGRNGAVKYTYDYGNSWSYRSVPTSLNLFSVHVGTFENIRVAGQQCNIWHTADKGLTWQKEYEEAGFQLYDIINVGTNTAYAVGTDSKILQTRDFGETWQKRGTDVTLYDTPLNAVTDRWATNNVWAVGHYGVILKNAGWESDFELQTEGYLNWLQAVEFINDSVGWAAGGVLTDFSSGESSGILLHTTDCGVTWEEYHRLNNQINDVDFIDEKNGWVVGRDGFIGHIVNGGFNTVESLIGGFLSSVCSTDGYNTWIVSRDNRGEIIHTGNAGGDWTVQTNPSKNPLHDVFFINNLKGWAVGLDSTIIRTVDGGQKWLGVAPYTVSPTRYTSVFFIDEKRGWVAGTGGVIVTTLDGGVTWEQVTSGTNELLESIYFIDQKNGWAAGDRGTILRSVDGGYNWFPQKNGVATNTLSSVHFTDALNGWIVGDGGTIIHTSNGGFLHPSGTFAEHSLGLPINDHEATQSTIEVNLTDWNKSAYILTGIEIYIDTIFHSRVSDLIITLSHNEITDTLVFHVNDDGENFLWTVLKDQSIKMITDGTAPFSGDYKPYQSLSVFNGTDPDGEWTLTIYDSETGENGVLQSWGIRPLFETGTAVYENKLTETTQKIKLEQNIPNPFSGKTIINWQSEIIGNTQLKIFNGCGQEIAMVLNKKLPVGKHSAEFNASKLSPGIYFYQLKVEKYIQTKKLIIQK